MELKDFSYFLPDGLIAQQPCRQRDQSRMMFVDRNKETIADSNFFQLPDFLNHDDVLVINDSKVTPARLFGKKQTGAVVEILLLVKKESKKESETWEVLLKPAKRLHKNDVILLDEKCAAKIIARISDKKWLMEFAAAEGFENFVAHFGRAPLPPYIKRKKDDEQNAGDLERYQTIYAKNPGSVAAPTAGLHFSADVLQSLRAKGVQIAAITLHVGLGTFLPIEVNEVENHVMEAEYYEISADAARLINNAERVIAVGTTSTRAIESSTGEDGYVHPQLGETSLFIYPGYRFKKVSGLLTNFHLPQSSLFLLVCAFAGTSFIRKVYQHAVQKRYNFYSYGDCMLIF